MEGVHGNYDVPISALDNRFQLDLLAGGNFELVERLLEIVPQVMTQA
jgi:hypothetical protein